MSARRFAYTVRMPAKSVATLDWLAERGYDANFRALATLVQLVATTIRTTIANALDRLIVSFQRCAIPYPHAKTL